MSLLEQEYQNYSQLMQIQEQFGKRIQRRSRFFLWLGWAFVLSQTLRLMVFCWKTPCFNPKIGLDETWPWSFCGILYFGTLLGLYLSFQFTRVLFSKKSQSQPLWLTSFQRWIRNRSQSFDIQQTKSLSDSIKRISHYRNVLILLR